MSTDQKGKKRPRQEESAEFLINKYMVHVTQQTPAAAPHVDPADKRTPYCQFIMAELHKMTVEQFSDFHLQTSQLLNKYHCSRLLVESDLLGSTQPRLPPHLPPLQQTASSSAVYATTTTASATATSSMDAVASADVIAAGLFPVCVPSPIHNSRASFRI